MNEGFQEKIFVDFNRKSDKCSLPMFSDNIPDVGKNAVTPLEIRNLNHHFISSSPRIS